jgi:hypothetical protein
VRRQRVLAGVVVVVLVAAIAMFSSGTVSLNLSLPSVPGTAMQPDSFALYVDGRSTGSLGQNLRLRLRTGSHQISVRHPRFHPHEVLVAVAGNQDRAIQLMPRPRVGSLQVITEPAGAEVLLGDTRLGRTPLRGVECAIGEHHITIRKDFYRELRRRVVIAESGMVRLRGEFALAGDARRHEGRLPVEPRWMNSYAFALETFSTTTTGSLGVLAEWTPADVPLRLRVVGGMSSFASRNQWGVEGPSPQRLDILVDEDKTKSGWFSGRYEWTVMLLPGSRPVRYRAWVAYPGRRRPSDGVERTGSLTEDGAAGAERGSPTAMSVPSETPSAGADDAVRAGADASAPAIGDGVPRDQAKSSAGDIDRERAAAEARTRRSLRSPRMSRGNFIDYDRKVHSNDAGQVREVRGRPGTLEVHPIDGDRPAMVTLDTFVPSVGASLIVDFCSSRDDCASSDHEVQIVVVGEDGMEHMVFSRVTRHHQGWLHQEVPLDRFAGQGVQVRFQAAAGGAESWCSEWSGLGSFYVVAR